MFYEVYLLSNNNTMKRIFRKILKISGAKKEVKTPYFSDTERTKKIERGAKDFADRFEGVMKDLANG